MSATAVFQHLKRIKEQERKRYQAHQERGACQPSQDALLPAKKKKNGLKHVRGCPLTPGRHYSASSLIIRSRDHRARTRRIRAYRPSHLLYTHTLHFLRIRCPVLRQAQSARNLAHWSRGRFYLLFLSVLYSFSFGRQRARLCIASQEGTPL